MDHTKRASLWSIVTPELRDVRLAKYVISLSLHLFIRCI